MKVERWQADAGQRDVVKLDIPADAGRERSFEIFVQLRVANRTGRLDATHALQVRVDGRLEWSRRLPTPADGGDSLDFRLRRSVPPGRPLRIGATCERHATQRVALTISAEED